MTYHQIRACDRGCQRSQHARCHGQNEQADEDQRDRPDEQEDEKQPRSQDEDDGRSEEGWGAEERCAFLKQIAPRRSVV